MTTLVQFTVGTAIRIDARFEDIDGDLYDPDVVRFRVMPPDGVEIAFVYGADPEVVRDAVGTFHAWVPATQEGEYCVRAETEGQDAVAAEAQFEVPESCFTLTP